MPMILDRLYHLHWVTPGVGRSAQPYLGFYAGFLRPHGFRGLINLRGENADFSWWQAEKAAAKALEIEHFDVRLSSRNLPSRPALKSLFEAIEAAPRPVLVKCSGGQDRTGLVSALYLLHLKGPGALKEAEAQFALWPYLHLPKRHQLWLKHFPAYAVSESRGATLSGWAKHGYDPQHFAQWLKAHGLAKSFDTFQVDAPA